MLKSIYYTKKQIIRPKHLFLNLTTLCNMSCKLCYNHLFDFEKKIMSLETAKKATNIFFNNRDLDYNGYYIMFFGGEPLLNFDLIPEYLDWFKNKYSHFKCDFHIFTNGLLLDKNKIDFFLNNNITIFVSHDNDIQSYNLHKSATKEEYENINKSLTYSLNKKPELVIPYYIINEKRISDLENYLIAVSKMGAIKIALTRKFFTKWGQTEINKVIEITRSFKEKNNISILVFPEIESNCDNCLTNNIMVYPNGDIYDLCVVSAGSLIKMELATDNIMKHFYLGSVFSCKTLKLNIKKKRLSLRIDPKSQICTYCPTINDSNFVKYLSDIHPIE